jgi:hypothetical protein
MGSTMFVLDWMAAPLRKAWARVGRARTQARLARIRSLASAGNRIHTMEGSGQVTWPPAPPQGQPRRVRVLRIVDAGVPATAAGRLVVSGRLADVCAELDRLVALEAAAA